MHSKERQQRVEFHSRETRPSQATSDREARRGSNNLAILGLMVKCAACVAVVTLLVVVGNGEHKAGMAGDVRGDAAQRATFNTPSRAAADRKEVFDARRARFEGNDAIPGRRIAAAAVAPDPASAQGLDNATCSGGINGGMDAGGSECNEQAATVR